MFKTIKNAFKTPDVRKRILYTLLLIVVFRLGCYITVPGVNSITLNEAMSSNNGVAGLIDMISGGAFSRFSVFAMSISPYITASIVIQLLGMIIPSLEKLTKEGGEEGRRKINRYTRKCNFLGKRWRIRIQRFKKKHTICCRTSCRNSSKSSYGTWIKNSRSIR